MEKKFLTLIEDGNVEDEKRSGKGVEKKAKKRKKKRRRKRRREKKKSNTLLFESLTEDVSAGVPEDVLSFSIVK